MKDDMSDMIGLSIERPYAIMHVSHIVAAEVDDILLLQIDDQREEVDEEQHHKQADLDSSEIEWEG